MSEIAHVEARTQAEALMLFVKILLARLGGQVTLTRSEIIGAKDYTGVRIAYNPNPEAEEPCTLTLLTELPKSDKI
jgi:hypothetical protein